MTSPYPQSKTLAVLHMSLWRPSKDIVRGQVYSSLIGAEDLTMNAGASLREPEDLALMYDDMHNYVKTSVPLFYGALEGATSYQPSLIK